MARDTDNDYIDKNEFYEALVQYKDRCQQARDQGLEVPRVTNYIGKCFLAIANGIAARSNFSNYPFREDMVQEGVENCLMVIENFDPSHNKKNAFGYFSKIIWWAYLRRIAKEKKSLYTKFKASHEMISMCETYVGGDEIKLSLNTDADYIDNFIRDYEDAEKRKKERLSEE